MTRADQQFDHQGLPFDQINGSAYLFDFSVTWTRNSYPSISASSCYQNLGNDWSGVDDPEVTNLAGWTTELVFEVSGPLNSKLRSVFTCELELLRFKW